MSSLLDEAIIKAREFLQGRKQSYIKVFGNKNDKFSRQVLIDLAKFCRANESTFHPDPYIRCQMDGRREVWLRIQQHLQLTDDELWNIYGKGTK